MTAKADGLDRFVSAQERVFDQVVAELEHGHKTSHWMWFIFPQLRGLGQSSMALKYGLLSASEALAYARHPVLGSRLVHCAQLMLAVANRSAHEILGSPDDLKLHSCMTLFNEVAPDEPVFAQVLSKYYDNAPDVRTIELLRRQKEGEP
jgi:uncharacterized protein (DUF1810 family)